MFPLAAPLSLLLAAAIPPTEPPAGLNVTFEGLRSQEGTLRICLSRNPVHFPDCSADPEARKLNIPASSASADFTELPHGTYALTAVHDQNDDGKLNVMLGVPREGFAFSNNPRIGFGPPSYDSVRFSLGPARAAIRVRFRYVI